MSILRRNGLIVVSLVGFIGAVLSIGRYQGTVGENIGVEVLVAILVFWLLSALFVAVRKVIRGWRDIWGPILRLAIQIHALKMTESQIEYVLDLAARQGPERPAQLGEVRNCIVSAPMLMSLTQDVLSGELDHIASELADEQLLWYRWHREGPHSFQLDFDSFKFVASPPTAKLIRIKQRMREDILRRFNGHSLESVVVVRRGNENYQMGPFFEELMSLLKCSSSTGFLTDVEKRQDVIWRREFAQKCNGKAVLVIDPLMVDCAIDDACEAIEEFKGVVAGALILFEVDGVKPLTLRNYDLLKRSCGTSELRGQLVLDLGKFSSQK